LRILTTQGTHILQYTKKKYSELEIINLVN
jgi:hypothetical protein